MPDLDDFHAFQSTTSGSGSNGHSSGSAGCLTWVLVVIGILWIIGKVAG